MISTHLWKLSSREFQRWNLEPFGRISTVTAVSASPPSLYEDCIRIFLAAWLDVSDDDEERFSNRRRWHMYLIENTIHMLKPQIFTIEMMIFLDVMHIL